MELAQGIHRIDRIRMVNCYLVINENGILLIDTGWPGDEVKTLAYLKKIGKNPSDIKYIVLTHGDLDHMGCAAELKKLTGAKLALHSGDAPIIRGEKEFKTFFGPRPLNYAIKMWMRSMPFHPVEPDLVLDGASEIENWKIIHTPGHTDGSICLFQPGKTIFVGDALRTGSNGKPRPVNRKVTLNVEQSRKSLQKLSELNYEALFPSHGAPILIGASLKIRKMVEHYLQADYK